MTVSYRSGGTLRSRAAAVALLLFAWQLVLLSAPRTTHASGPCDPPVNVIVCENSKPGDPASQWDIVGAGDPGIQGFATDISVNHGQTVHFKIATNAQAYHLDVYRIGYYAGMGARKVATVYPSVSLPQSQPACLFDSATRLVDCGNWAESASWAVPADAVSGIYLAKIIRDQGPNQVNHIVFILRDDDRRADILFQTSDGTWEAYNRFGGYSYYYPSGTQGSRAYKVSYNRPFITRACCDETWLMSPEYPMVRWLESNGFDVSYFTDVDAARSGAELLNHRVYMPVGHDEYWSGQQRANVETARNAGVNLAFFSGNEIFWKTRWENSIDGSATAYRTMVSYKETNSNAKIDPDPSWTGTWRDPRFSPPSDGGRPENALTGTSYSVNCCATPEEQDSSVKVPADDGKMRFWRNTSVATQGPGEIAVMPIRTLGFEWDEDADNGFRPPGLIHLTTSTYDVQQHLIDYGNTYVPDTVTHHATLYRASSGALVFGAGTVRWMWGLDSHHQDPPSVVDPRMQQATINLLADMGVQPASLQPGMVVASASTDTTAPSSTVTSPAPGTTATPDAPLTITGTATDQGGGVVGGVEVSVDGGASWHAASGRSAWTYMFTPGTPGTLSIRSRAADDSGNIETPSSGISITIASRSCPCTIWTTASPHFSTAKTATELGVKFRADYNGYVAGIRFYKGTANTGTHTGHLWSRTGTLLATATFTGETASGWQQVSFASPVAVTANTTYVASYFAPNGGFAQDVSYFAAKGVDRAPLHALANGVDGPNGVYKTSSAFPNLTYSSSNYWVDVSYLVAPPASPTGLTATPASSTRINLSWNDVAGETGFKIQRSPEGTTWALIDTLGQNVTSYADTGLGLNTTYSYRVLATNPGGDSSPSPVASATTFPAPPPSPNNLIATSSSNSVDLAWSAVIGEASQISYRIQRSGDGVGGWSQIGVTDVGAIAYTDTGLTPLTTYYYRVIATDIGGDSPPSNVATITTKPPVPTGVTATAASASEIDVSWTDVSGETGYKVERSPDGTANWTEIGTSAQEVTTYSDTGLAPATTYYYRVIATGNSGDSAPSSTASATTNSVGSAPPSPSGLAAATASSSQIDLSWTDVTGETSYKIQRSLDGTTSWADTGGTGQDATSYSDTGLSAGTAYFYRVVASNADGDSGPSNVASATTQPAGPTGLTAATGGTTQINLSWTDVVGETGYKIQRSADGTTNWSDIGTTAHNVVTFTDGGLTPATAYFYRVLATNTGGDSVASSVATATTKPVAPSGLTARALSPSQVSLSWTDVTGESNYKIQRSPDGSTGWSDVGTTAQNVVAFTDAGLSQNTPYFYRVVAANAGGDSAPSNIATATTTNLCPCSFWQDPVSPHFSTATTATELGVKFRADYNGYVAGIRFYKGTANTGTHTGHLWSRTGTLLATATFTGETASGWQQVSFASPVAVTANTTYVASYFAPNGGFAQDVSYFAAKGVDRAPLHALANGVDGPNGVYKTSSAFPNLTYSSSNYWVDIVFTTVPTPTGLTATPASSTRINLSWTDVSGESGYKIQRSPDGTTNWVQVGTTGQGVSTFGDTGLPAGTPYFYRVIAFSTGGDSQPSSVATAQTSP